MKSGRMHERMLLQYKRSEPGVSRGGNFKSRYTFLIVNLSVEAAYQGISNPWLSMPLHLHFLIGLWVWTRSFHASLSSILNIKD